MALEGKWGSVGPINIIQASPGLGTIIPADTALLKVGMIVSLSSSVRSENYRIVYVDKQQVRVISLDTKAPVDMADFDPSNLGMLSAYEQQKIIVAEDDQDTDRWEKGPTNADRNVLVDQWGDFYGTANPLPVQLSDGSINIGTVNAQLEMFLSHKDNDPHPGDIHSSIRIGDGEDVLAINPDGSINANVTIGGNSPSKSYFGESSAVASGLTVTVIEWTASVDCRLQKVAFSGENCAEWELLVDGNTVDKFRTWFSNFNGSFDFGNGLEIDSGVKIEVKVYNFRPDSADFNARIQVVEG